MPEAASGSKSGAGGSAQRKCEVFSASVSVDGLQVEHMSLLSHIQPHNITTHYCHIRHIISLLSHTQRERERERCVWSRPGFRHAEKETLKFLSLPMQARELQARSRSMQARADHNREGNMKPHSYHKQKDVFYPSLKIKRCGQM